MSDQPTQRTRLRRSHQKGAYDRASVDAVLDASMLCHVAYLRDGKPSVTPTMHWRTGDAVYWHGSSASSALRNQTRLDVCLCVSIIDGIVFARSAFNHSVNFRSAILYGTAQLVEDADEKSAHLEDMVERMTPGRWAELRPMTSQELKATSVLRLPIDEASAKVRMGGPKDNDGDMDFPVWAGHVPMGPVFGEAIPCPDAVKDFAVPDYLGHAIHVAGGEVS